MLEVDAVVGRDIEQFSSSQVTAVTLGHRPHYQLKNKLLWFSSEFTRLSFEICWICGQKHLGNPDGGSVSLDKMNFLDFFPIFLITMLFLFLLLLGTTYITQPCF